MDFLTSNKMASFTSNTSTATANAADDPLGLVQSLIQSPVASFLPAIMALAFLAYISYTPSVKKGVPEFTPLTYPIIGSYRFFTHKLSFWREAVSKSKTGAFSFWLGKNHVVGVSGEAGRKIYLEHPDMDHIKGVVLIGHGPDYINGTSTPQHSIWKPTAAGGKSYAQKRLQELQKTSVLTQRLPNVTRDARRTFEAVAGPQFNGIVNPAHMCYRLVCEQATRIVGSDMLVDDPENNKKLMHYLPILQMTSSCHLLSFPWASYFSLSYWKRQYGRNGMRKLVTPLVEERMKKDAKRYDDALQHFIDQGDSPDYIINFLISMIFISGANGCVLAGAMLYSIAHHPEWQNAIYKEIKSVANANCKDPNASLVDQLDSLPVQAWENMSPSIDQCYKECIRMWVAFPMGRMNEGSEDIVIPGTNGQIIPAGGLASYNTIDCHFNEKLFPEPMKWDPARFGEGRKEMEQEAHGFMGWGAGRHPCNGIRWAKIQQNMILAYALAMYEWSGCFKNGEPNPEFIPPTTALNELAPALPQNLYCKAVPRKD